MWKSVVALLVVALLPWWASTLAHRMGVRGDFARTLFGAAPDEAVWEDLAPPAGWREDAYLAAYADVADAVRLGDFSSGYEHYRLFGRAEGRTAGLYPPAPDSAEPQTAEAPEPAPAAPVPAMAEPAPSAGPPAPALPAPASPPPGSDIRYVIRSGGTLARVAEVTGYTSATLRAANPELPDVWLPAGTEVRLPARAAAAPPAPPPAAVPARPPEPPAAVAVTVAVPPPKPRPPQPAPAPQAAAPMPAPATAAAPGSAVTALRFGTHPDATRIVLDLSGPAERPAPRQADPRTLIVDLPHVAWTTARRGTLARAAPALAFRAEPLASGGTRLTLSGDGAIRVKYAAHFPPSGERGHRMVIDVTGGP
ncbi:AMIN domain-containing protein [Azospirillum halopraeferens]|uniref:AMIN domain-containing protein n=1 Tax=Azospirillum halopraeferens TaxID=34010 RepID=UPI000400E89F|nr:AMIN domain-containing protein [Azospirillum halopraeferens]